MENETRSDRGTPHVVIVGGGFAGLHAAARLACAPVRVTLLDRRNHHVFQPLLYQVATASLSPAQIAWPIRKIVGRSPRITVHLGEVRSIDPRARTVTLDDRTLAYDYLVLATGVSHSYFGHDAWAPHAPGLKSIEDALEIRRRFLTAFELADRATTDAERREALTFVVVGGGPTGVELAGAIAEIAHRAIARDFHTFDTSSARVVLIEASDRVLATFPPELSERAARDLRDLGVEVRLGERVTAIDGHGVTLESPRGTERLASRTVLWAAGVRASPLAAALGAGLDRAGRVLVNPDLTVPGSPEVYVAGDLASLTDPRTGRPVPGVAPAAMQMGRFVGDAIARRVRGVPTRKAPAFRYINKGELATIGRAKAVGVLGFGLETRLTGWACWAFWALVHLAYLIGMRTRLLVMIDWMWSYFFFERGARLITTAWSPPTPDTPGPRANP